MILPINKTLYPKHSLLSQCSSYNPLEKNNKNEKNNSESNSTNTHHPNQHHSKLTNGNNNRHHTNDSSIYLYSNKFCKGNNCQYKYKEQPLNKDIGCNVHEKGAYITETNCH